MLGSEAVCIGAQSDMARTVSPLRIHEAFEQALECDAIFPALFPLEDLLYCFEQTVPVPFNFSNAAAASSILPAGSAVEAVP